MSTKAGSMIQVCELSDYTPLEYYFIEHCEVDQRKSVLGWLLTLNKEEFKEVSVAVRKEESLLPLLILTDCELVEGVSLNKGELDKVSTQLKGAISLVHGIKKGDIGFNPKEKDEDWEFYKK